MTVDDGTDDPILAVVASLKTHDVSERQTRRLRRRCYALLQAPPPEPSAATISSLVFRRIVGPALGGAWCLAYLVEIFRRAAAVFGAQ